MRAQTFEAERNFGGCQRTASLILIGGEPPIFLTIRSKGQRVLRSPGVLGLSV